MKRSGLQLVGSSAELDQQFAKALEDVQSGQERFLMTGETARILRRCEQSVRLYAEAGKLPSIKTTNGRHLFKESDVRRLAKELESK